MARQFKVLLTFLFTFLVLGLTAHARADAPSVIRIGYPGVGVGNRPASFGNSIATLHLRGALEDEFKKDGIKIQWTFLRGAGPAVNELFANGLLDFSHLGDLPSVVGRACGLKHLVLALGQFCLIVGIVFVGNVVIMLAVEPVIEERANRNSCGKLRNATRMIGMIMRDEDIIDLVQAGSFRRCDDAIRVETVATRPARVDEQRLPGRCHEER